MIISSTETLSYLYKDSAISNMNIEISTDKNRLQVPVIMSYLTEQSYWAKGRAEDRILKSIEHSFCFGVYVDDQQVGFARVVTDFAVFAWIMDLFILPDHQGKGYGKQLMAEIKNHPTLSSVTRWGLNTEDAHGLYKKFGFTQIKNPKIHMEQVIK